MYISEQGTEDIKEEFTLLGKVCEIDKEDRKGGKKIYKRNMTLNN